MSNISLCPRQQAVFSASYNKTSKTFTIHVGEFGQLFGLSNAPGIWVNNQPLYVEGVAEVINSLSAKIASQKTGFFVLTGEPSVSESINKALAGLKQAITHHNNHQKTLQNLDGQKLANELNQLGIIDATAAERTEIQEMTTALVGQPGWILN